MTAHLNTHYKTKHMKQLLIFILFFSSVQAQTVDTVIKKDIYESYFNYKLREPLYVKYELFKGGGNCSRSGMAFETGGLKYSATAADYAKNGFDEGHLANAEDFASDCDKEKETFFYFNCVPQTARLNRGIWKTWETKIRKESQTDKLVIICGSIFQGKTIGKDKIGVPAYCWKVVLKNGTVTHCLYFPNDQSDQVQEITVKQLKEKIPYKIDLF